MARIDRIVARRAESARKPRVIYDNAGPGRRVARTHKTKQGVGGVITAAVHKQGNPWWRKKAAEIAERNLRAMKAVR